MDKLSVLVADPVNKTDSRKSYKLLRSIASNFSR